MTSTPTPAPQRSPRRRVAVGPSRPQYLHSVENDHMMMVITALAGEFSALRDRLDTHEALAEQGVLATADAVETYVQTPERVASREAMRLAMLKRIFRVYTEELDEARRHAASRSTAADGAWVLPDGDDGEHAA